MKAPLLRALLAFSLLINLGVLGVAAYRSLSADDFPGLPHYLDLNAQQTQHWREAEQSFLAQLAEDTSAIETHRTRMIRAILTEVPDLAQIDAERAAIAALQDAQQKRVIAQLLKERDLLNGAQRERLAALLLTQPAGHAGVDRLHRE